MGLIAGGQFLQRCLVNFCTSTDLWEYSFHLVHGLKCQFYSTLIITCCVLNILIKSPAHIHFIQIKKTLLVPQWNINPVCFVLSLFACPINPPWVFTLHQKEHSSNRSDPPLQNVVFSSYLGTLNSRECCHQPKRPKHNGSDHEGPGHLNVSYEQRELQYVC